MSEPAVSFGFRSSTAVKKSKSIWTRFVEIAWATWQAASTFQSGLTAIMRPKRAISTVRCVLLRRSSTASLTSFGYALFPFFISFFCFTGLSISSLAFSRPCSCAAQARSVSLCSSEYRSDLGHDPTWYEQQNVGLPQILSGTLLVPAQTDTFDRCDGELRGVLPFVAVFIVKDIGDLLDEALCTRSAVLVVHEPLHFEDLAYRALLALARDTCPPMASKFAVLGRAGVIAIEVGRSEVLKEVQLDFLHVGRPFLKPGFRWAHCCRRGSRNHVPTGAASGPTGDPSIESQRASLASRLPSHGWRQE